MMMRSRIIALSYLNTIPFIYGIEHADVALHADLILSPPRNCAASLRNGEADIALIPVAAIPTIPDIRIITPYCIGASNSVRTVVLASNTPISQIDTIYLDSHSLTSVGLVRVLSSRWWHVSPEWRAMEDFSVLDDPQDRTGYLMIGDKVFTHENNFRYYYDLADQWREMTGLSFVFAAWVARKCVPEERVAELTSALRYGVGHISQAISCYHYDDKPYAYDYLTKNIDYRFDEEKHRALKLYWTEKMKVDPPIGPG